MHGKCWLKDGAKRRKALSGQRKQVDKKREYSENKCGSFGGKGQNIGLEVGGNRRASCSLEGSQPG